MAAEKPIHLLLIEDNLEDATILQYLLGEQHLRHIETKHALDLRSALKMLSEYNFDAVISDLNLTDSTGLDTFHAIHSASPSLPIVILSGLDEESTAIQALREGAQDYLVKGKLNATLLVRAILYAIERTILSEANKNLIKELEMNLSKIKTLSGLLPICSICHKVRNDKGYWEQVEQYLSQHAEVEFTHGFCPQCIKKLYPDLVQARKKNKNV